MPAPRKPANPSAAYLPPPWDIADAKALQKLAAGEASAAQQQRAIKWIIETAAATYDLPFRPGMDGARDTDFACGRMFVGQQIVKLIKVDLLALQKKNPQQPKE